MRVDLGESSREAGGGEGDEEVRPPVHGDERLGEDVAAPIDLMPVGKQPWRTYLFCFEGPVVPGAYCLCPRTCYSTPEG